MTVEGGHRGGPHLATQGFRFGGLKLELIITATGITMSVGGSFAGMQDLDERVRDAVKLFWETREGQAKKQASAGKAVDKGSRSSVTGGRHMDGFGNLISKILQENGVSADWINNGKRMELPGFYRPEKRWDLVLAARGKLLAAMEFKSHVGPSFGNNFNNRAEEAIGDATDIRATYRAGAIGQDAPWLGYLILLHKNQESTDPVEPKEPHFRVMPEFASASYARRYEILCERLVSEKLYDASCLLLSEGTIGKKVHLEEPNPSSSFSRFVTALLMHVVPRTGHSTIQRELPPI